MGVVLHLVSLLACLQTVYLYPTQQGEGGSPLFENMRLAKRPLYPYREALLSRLGLLHNPKMNQGQRKKAVDSTFIRFGRSSSAPLQPRNERSIDDVIQESIFQDHSPILQRGENPNSRQESSSYEEDVPDTKAPQQIQRGFLLDHHGCRVRDEKELMRALLSDPNCIRAFQKKNKNVDSTFLRFGKREAPPEKEFESILEDSSSR